jgi:curved DNA-binding protein CbpA
MPRQQDFNDKNMPNSEYAEALAAIDNAYAILGLNSSATEAEIRKAYLKETRINHPDKGGDSEKFKEIGNAYELLQNLKAEEKELNARADHSYEDPIRRTSSTKSTATYSSDEPTTPSSYRPASPSSFQSESPKNAHSTADAKAEKLRQVREAMARSVQSTQASAPQQQAQTNSQAPRQAAESSQLPPHLRPQSSASQATRENIRATMDNLKGRSQNPAPEAAQKPAQHTSPQLPPHLRPLDAESQARLEKIKATMDDLKSAEKHAAKASTASQRPDQHSSQKGR